MKLTGFLGIVLLTACQTVMDTSPEAWASGDLTLVSALSEGPCSSMPVGGGDLCRFKESTPIESSWRLVIPHDKSITGGQITVYWKDFSKVYPVTSNVVEVPLKDLMDHEKWQLTDRGAATALAELKFKGSDGLERSIRAEATALIIVLKQGYEPLPIDSGVQNWGLKCEVQYSSAGRSALRCK